MDSAISTPGAWTPAQRPIPEHDPLGIGCKTGSMRVGNIRLDLKAHVNVTTEPQPMCLTDADVVSDAVIRKGRWFDCGRFVRLWRGLVQPQVGDTLIEVGANIGSCTLEILLRTNASIVAIEPNAINLYRLTRTLSLAAKRDPSLAHRVVVLPIGGGEHASQEPLYAQRNNLGNSVIGQAITDDAGELRTRQFNQSFLVPQTVRVLPLDDIWPSAQSLHGVRLMKLDTQGFECKVLDGARRLLRTSTRLDVIVSEFATDWLSAQCCGMRWLKHLMTPETPEARWQRACQQGTGESFCVSRRVPEAGSARSSESTPWHPRVVTFGERVDPERLGVAQITRLQQEMSWCQAHPERVAELLKKAQAWRNQQHQQRLERDEGRRFRGRRGDWHDAKRKKRSQT